MPEVSRLLLEQMGYSHLGKKCSAVAGSLECTAGSTGSWIMGAIGVLSSPHSSLSHATVIVKPSGAVFLVLVRVVGAGLLSQV